MDGGRDVSVLRYVLLPLPAWAAAVVVSEGMVVVLATLSSSALAVESTASVLTGRLPSS